MSSPPAQKPAENGPSPPFEIDEVAGAAKTARETVEPHAPGTDPRGGAGAKRVYHCLVVEDSPMMRQLLVFALSRVKQLRVTEADDGVDGLRKLAMHTFDIVLTDINMPIMDGLKLVRRVRTDRVHRDVPIVVITTESADEDRQRALALGANTYITKPIQAPHLIAKVKELLGIAEG